MNKCHGLLLAALASASLAACGQGAESGQQVNMTTAGSASATGGETAAPAGGQAGGQTIGQALSQSPDHSTLLAAVNAAGLGGTLGGAGPYTVFAPTNAAFAKLPAGAADGLMQPANKAALVAVLRAHVVPGVVTSKDLAAALKRRGGKTQLATMNGNTLLLTEANGEITIAGKNGPVRVVRPDMLQSNGVVHSIDTVLLPD